MKTGSSEDTIQNGTRFIRVFILSCVVSQPLMTRKPKPKGLLFNPNRQVANYQNKKNIRIFIFLNIIIMIRLQSDY